MCRPQPASRTTAAPISPLAALLIATACAQPDDSAATPEPTGQTVTIQAATADDFAAGVPADGIVISLHACQPGPRCEPVEWYISDGMLYPVAPHPDFRVVWLR